MTWALSSGVPTRLTAINDHLIAQGIDAYFSYFDAPLATFEQLLRVHPACIWSASSGPLRNTASPTSTRIRQCARIPGRRPCVRQAPACLAVDLVMGHEVQNAFCAVRPPGHHAERTNAMGFCFFNNIAVAAAHAMAVHGIERVAIIDFDVHHGNGTEDIFWR